MRSSDRSEHRYDVAIVGGGVLGCATAWRLAQRRVSTVVVERQSVNSEASGSNAGSIHLQLRHQDLETDARLELLARAVHAWDDVEAELGVSLEVHRHGGVMVAENEQDAAFLREKVVLERQMGLRSSLVTGTEVAEVLPGVSPGVICADFCADEGSVNPLLATRAVADAARRSGATILERTELREMQRCDGGFRLLTTDGEIVAERVVNAAGAWAGSIAAMVGVELPISGDMIVVNVTEPWQPTLGCLVQHAGARLTLKQNARGNFLIGGGWEAGSFSDDDRRSDARAVRGNLEVATRIYPVLGSARLMRSWVGAIAVAPDRLPIIGGCEVPGFYILVVPRASAGYTLAPVLGTAAADLITSGRTDIALDAFAPDRRFGLASASRMEGR